MTRLDSVRSLVREVLTTEARRGTSPRRKRPGSSARSLTAIITKYPRIVGVSKRQESGHYGTWDAVVTSRNPVQELEKLAVYKTMADNGPDVSYVRVGRLLPRIRRAAGRKGILGAYEAGELTDVLDGLGLFGATGDQVRDDTDRYF